MEFHFFIRSFSFVLKKVYNIIQYGVYTPWKKTPKTSHRMYLYYYYYTLSVVSFRFRALYLYAVHTKHDT